MTMTPKAAPGGPAIRFKARLMKPANTAGAASWTFLVLPKGASAKLPTRATTTVDGTLNGQSFKAALEPDGNRSHWLRVPRKLREAAGVRSGDIVTLEITPARSELEAKPPADLRNALAATPKAQASWSNITPTARRDWIQWIISAKRSDTRARRIGNACKMLGSGKRRVCCFDRSGFYGGNFSAPAAAPVRKARSK